MLFRSNDTATTEIYTDYYTLSLHDALPISSPLLDNVSISGATGVLLNVTGGQDLTLGEVTAIADIIHDAAGDDANIIFGAVHEPAMQGEIRVTVVATGFARAHSVTPGQRAGAAAGTPVIPIDGGRSRPVIGSAYPIPGAAASGGGAAPARRPAQQPAPERRPIADVDDLEIPTFIRRQMD